MDNNILLAFFGDLGDPGDPVDLGDPGDLGDPVDHPDLGDPGDPGDPVDLGETAVWFLHKPLSAQEYCIYLLSW